MYLFLSLIFARQSVWSTLLLHMYSKRNYWANLIRHILDKLVNNLLYMILTRTDLAKKSQFHQHYHVCCSYCFFLTCPKASASLFVFFPFFFLQFRSKALKKTPQRYYKTFLYQILWSCQYKLEQILRRNYYRVFYRPPESMHALQERSN